MAGSDGGVCVGVVGGKTFCIPHPCVRPRLKCKEQTFTAIVILDNRPQLIAVCQQWRAFPIFSIARAIR